MIYGYGVRARINIASALTLVSVAEVVDPLATISVLDYGYFPALRYFFANSASTSRLARIHAASSS